jgi:hypothetical protein
MIFKKKTVAEKLRERSEWYTRDLPDVVHVPALKGHRDEDITVALGDATLDQLAFAIAGIEAQVAKARVGLTGLRELYEQARKRGGVGTNTVADVFFSDEFKEVTK